MSAREYFGEFLDLFTWLPNGIASSLLQLESSVRAGDDPPEEAPFLNDMRTLTAGLVHHFFESSTHSRAMTILSEVWKAHRPFMLYLRGFHLGAKVLGPIPALPGALFNASEEVLTIGRQNDWEFQEVLASAIAPTMPVLGIENPDNSLRIEKVPKLVVPANEWQSIVSRLIRAARVIVVYSDRPTPGVMQELELILNAGRASHTLLVQESDETESLWEGTPAETPFDQFVFQPAEQIRGAWDQMVERFSNLRISHSSLDSKALVAAIAAIASRDEEGDFSGPAPVPSSIVPTGAGSALASTEMQALLNLAQRHVRSGEYCEAERKLYGSLVRTFVVDAPRMRASVFLELGRVQALCLQRPVHGIDNFKRSLELWDRLGIPEMKADVLQEIAAVEASRGNLATARRYAEDALAVNLPERNYWGEFCCWNTLYGIALKQERSDEAESARSKALMAYYEFRRQGGTPPRPSTRCLAAFLGFVAQEIRSGQNADVSRYRSWLRNNQDALRCRVEDGIAHAVHAFLTKQLSEDDLLSLGEGLDQGFELLMFIESWRSASETAL